MSNRFKNLDLLFPCGDQRLSGEVVGVTVQVLQRGSPRGEMFWKRKSWFVNASVNAWHMHRGLCREFETDYSGFNCCSELSVKRALGDIVLYAYLQNYATKGDLQYSSYECELGGRIPEIFSSVSSGSMHVRVPLDGHAIQRMFDSALCPSSRLIRSQL
jgi:hypothetical protein